MSAEAVSGHLQSRREGLSLTPMAFAKRTFPQQIGGALHGILAHFDTGGRFELVRLMRVWPETVGDAIARRTEVTSVKFHTAVIKVSGAMWIQELGLMKPQILGRLREALGDDSVREIRFVQGRLSRRETPRLRVVPRAPRHAIDLPELKDPELRRAFANLIEAWGRASR
jgi:predicted nucleic acid-binding Zn ribbon protein